MLFREDGTAYLVCSACFAALGIPGAVTLTFSFLYQQGCGVSPQPSDCQKSL